MPDLGDIISASCLDENVIAEFLLGRLSDAQIHQIEAHVDACGQCRDLLVTLTRARSRTPSPPPLSIGEIVAEKYRIERLVGSGGMGVVFMATHLLLDRQVALKVMRVDLVSDRESSERFLREARLLVRLKGEHAARVLDVGTLADGAPFIVMDYLDGEDLGRVMRAGPLSVEVAALYISQACDAIAEAHGLGIVHRDLKPSNLFLTRRPDGSPCIKVLDFGLSKVSGDEHELSLTGSRQVIGSPLFMAPEQLVSSRQVDARADLWALGATLYFLVTAKPPFEAVSLPELSAAVLRDAPRPPRREMPTGLWTIVSRCLEKDPATRIASAAELARLLAPFGRHRADRGERPRSTQELVQAAARRSRNRWPMVFAALLLGLVLGGGVGFYSRTTSHGVAARIGPPVVLIMDTPVARGVYDAEALARGETNADVLNDLLRDLPVAIVKETLPATWNRETSTLQSRADLVVIHRSAFFHALNAEFGFGSKPFPDEQTEQRWLLLYRTADDKLIAFLGLVGTTYPSTRFLVYSRGTDGRWPAEPYRKQWVKDVERRFPALTGHITTMLIEGGVESGSFRNPSVAGEIRADIKAILGL